MVREQNAADERHAAEYKKVIGNAEGEITKLFATWSASTVEGENGTVIDWHGRASNLIWIEYRPAWNSFLGRRGPEGWAVWASTKEGRYFQVYYWLSDDMKFEATEQPRPVSRKELAEALLDAKRNDIIDKIGLPRSSA